MLLETHLPLVKENVSYASLSKKMLLKESWRVRFTLLTEMNFSPDLDENGILLDQEESVPYLQLKTWHSLQANDPVHTRLYSLGCIHPPPPVTFFLAFKGSRHVRWTLDRLI